MVPPVAFVLEKGLPAARGEFTLAFADGEMAEWFKAHAWKACVGLYPTEGSNPSLSASLRP